MKQEQDIPLKALTSTAESFERLIVQEWRLRSLMSVKFALEQLMREEQAVVLGCEAFERSGDRRGYRNGVRTRSLLTALGPIEELQVPRMRGMEYQTALFERYQKLDRALTEAIEESYIRGLSVRDVGPVIEKLAGDTVSPAAVSRLNGRLDEAIEKFANSLIEGEIPYVYLDAAYFPIVTEGTKRQTPVLCAIGVGSDGKRKLLGWQLARAELADAWDLFIAHLVKKGLKGVKLFVVDGHPSIWTAVEKHFPGTKIQYCVVHFKRALFRHAPKELCTAISKAIDEILYEKDPDEVERKKDRFRVRFRKYPALVRTFSEWIDKTRVFRLFPSKHWKRIYTNNGIEGLQREVKRRTRAIGPIPGHLGAERIIAHTLFLATGKWDDRIYLDMNLLQSAQGGEQKHGKAA